MAEAAEFVKEKLKLTTKHMTRNMRDIIYQYFKFKSDT